MVSNIKNSIYVKIILKNMGCGCSNISDNNSFELQLNNYICLKSFFKDSLVNISSKTTNLSSIEVKKMTNNFVLGKKNNKNEIYNSDNNKTFSYYSKLEEILIRIIFILDIQIKSFIGSYNSKIENILRTDLVVFQKGFLNFY